MNRVKFHVKKGDNVEVISGNHKGSSGKVLEVFPRKQHVLIEGVRMIKKHLRKSQDNPKGRSPSAKVRSTFRTSSARARRTGDEGASRQEERRRKKRLPRTRAQEEKDSRKND